MCNPVEVQPGQPDTKIRKECRASRSGRSGVRREGAEVEDDSMLEEFQGIRTTRLLGYPTAGADQVDLRRAVR